MLAVAPSSYSSQPVRFQAAIHADVSCAVESPHFMTMVNEVVPFRSFQIWIGSCSLRPSLQAPGLSFLRRRPLSPRCGSRVTISNDVLLSISCVACGYSVINRLFLYGRIIDDRLHFQKLSICSTCWSCSLWWWLADYDQPTAQHLENALLSMHEYALAVQAIQQFAHSDRQPCCARITAIHSEG